MTIVAKYIARRNGQTVAEMTRMIAGTLTDAAELLGADLSLEARIGALLTDLESATPAEQLEVLHALAQEAKGLHGKLRSKGTDVPSDAMPYIYRFFELTEAMAAAEHSR